MKKPPEPPPGPPPRESPANDVSDGFGATVPVSGEVPRQRDDATLQPGLMIAGRYQVVRYIARGGMGQVYEVDDLELHERVALKTLRQETRDDEARFKREILLSRKVTHRNVCRIFDVGYHELGGERMVFLTMELLRGRTLLEHIGREGPLPLPEVARILRQIVAGLSAAHGAKIVHRDLKSANVLLVTRGQSLRVAITDFGLAHHSLGDAQSAEVLGTPAYMAPEQLQGGAVTPRTDVYALGVVLYEMLTGALPFTGDTPIEVANQRLTAPAPSPKKLRADLPTKWERTVLACLERDPARRPASVREVLQLLDLFTDSIEEVDGTVRVARTRRRVPLVRPALVLLVLAVGAFFGDRWYSHRGAPMLRTLATLSFTPTERSADKDPGLGAIAAELVRTRLGASRWLQIADGPSTSSALRQIGATSAVTDAELDRLHSVLTVDLFIVGTFQVDGDGSVELVARLVDGVHHKTLGTVRAAGPRAELSVVLAKLAAELGRAAGAEAAEVQAGIDFTLPEKADSLREIAAATELSQRGELSAARAKAEAAATSEPAYARAHLILADICHQLGNERRADEEARRAAELAVTLPRRERMFVEGVAAVITRQHTVALERLKTLHRELPTDVEVSARLVRALESAGKYDDAFELLQAVRIDAKSAGLRHRLDELESEIAVSMGDYDHALLAARQALAESTAMGATLSRADDRLNECRILTQLNRSAEGRPACIDARAVAGDSGERRLRAQAVDAIADIDFWAGDVKGAEQSWRELLPSVREIGDQELEIQVLANLGAAAYQRNDIVEARRWWNNAVEVADTLRNELAGDSARQSLAGLELEAGNMQVALPLLERVEKAYHDGAPIEDYLDAMCRVADVHMSLGQSRELDQKLAEIDAVRERASTRPAVENCLAVNEDLDCGRGHPERAIAALREAVALRVKGGTTVGLSNLRFMLAEVLEDVGDASGALAQIDAISALGELSSDDAVLLSARLMRLRLAHTRMAPAAITAALDNEERLAAQEPLRFVQAVALFDLERTRAVVGPLAPSLRALHAMVQRAEREGWVRLSLDIELHTLELEAQHGHRPPPAIVHSFVLRARAAGVPGWAERVEGLSASGGKKR